MDGFTSHTHDWMTHTTEIGWEDSIKDKLLSSEDCHFWNQQYNPEQVIKKQWCTKDREWRKCLQVATSVICVNLCTAKRIWWLWTSYNLVPDPLNPPLCIKSVYFPIWSMQSHMENVCMTFLRNLFLVTIYYGNLRNSEHWMAVLFV